VGRVKRKGEDDEWAPRRVVGMKKGDKSKDSNTAHSPAATMPHHHAVSSSCDLHLLLHLVQKDMHPIRSERSPLRRPQAGAS
jgi:hypothetical protein